jgi:hypothetical protein
VQESRRLVRSAARRGAAPAGRRPLGLGGLPFEAREIELAEGTAPHLRRARTTDEGGRGLFLVARMAERWGTRYTREGKTVWTEQPLTGMLT